MFAGVAWAPLLALIAFVLAAASASGAAGAWHLQQGRVERAELAAENSKTRLTSAASESAGLKRQLAEVSANRKQLDDRVVKQAAQITQFEAASDSREKAVEAGLASARAAIADMRGQAATLAARVRAVRPGATCADAWADIRASIRGGK